MIMSAGAQRRARLAGAAALALTLVGCANAPEATAVAAPAPQNRGAILPRAAHHQHLLSPVLFAQWRAEDTKPPVPRAALPVDLERLLKAREAASGADPIDDLFTENARIMMTPENVWARGRAEVKDFLALIAPGRRYTPQAFRADGSAAWIAGVVERDNPAREVGTFVMGMDRGADGRWRIASESTAAIRPPDYTAPITADELIADMDEAGVERAVLLSLGYSWASAGRETPVENEHDKVRAENDWTAAEAARFPTRLVAFCGVNPLRDYAVAEVARCAALAHVKGMKLHFGNSGVDVKNPEHVEKLRRLFTAADRHGLAIVAHVMPRNAGDYGAEHSRILLEQILPAAPNVPVQIAHMAGSGPSYGPDEPVAFLAAAFAAGDPRLRNVYVDIAGLVPQTQSDETWALMAKRLRQIGMERVLFGSDMHPNPSLLNAWATMRRKLGLADAELAAVADNVAPYLR